MPNTSTLWTQDFRLRVISTVNSFSVSEANLLPSFAGSASIQSYKPAPPLAIQGVRRRGSVSLYKASPKPLSLFKHNYTYAQKYILYIKANASTLSKHGQAAPSRALYRIHESGTKYNCRISPASNEHDRADGA